MKQKRTAAATMTTDASAEQPTPSRDIAAALQTLLQAFSRGDVQIRDGIPVVEPASPPRRTSIRKLRRTHGEDLARVMSELREPLRQRKQRVMPIRKVYSLVPVKSETMIRELQAMAPAGAAIVIFLADHPKTSAPALCASLDFAKKTVDNWLSKLRQKKLVVAEDVSR